MWNLFRTIFTPGNFEPHSVHFVDSPATMWLIVVGHALSLLAYILIPVTILFIVWKRKDLVYNWMFLLFGAFIALCGFTHAMHIIIFWYPAYYLEAFIEVITFAVSFATFLMFLYIIPMVVKLTSPKEMEEANKELFDEIKSHEQVEKEIQQRNQEMEKANREILDKNYAFEKLNESILERTSKMKELGAETERLKKLNTN